MEARPGCPGCQARVMLTTRETDPAPARQEPPLVLSAGFNRQGDAGTMAPRRTRWQLGAAIVIALMTTACSDSLSTGNAILPNGAADDIGATARDEVEAAVSALTLPSSVDPSGHGPGRPPPTHRAVSLRQHRPTPTGTAFPTTPSTCSPLPPADSPAGAAAPSTSWASSGCRTPPRARPDSATRAP